MVDRRGSKGEEREGERGRLKWGGIEREYWGGGGVREDAGNYPFLFICPPLTDPPPPHTSTLKP